MIRIPFGSSIPVFCYHNVSEVDGHSPERFGEHLDAIEQAGFSTLSALDLLAVVRKEKKAPPKSVVLTFDDGHLSNWLTVVPELMRRGMTGTFFVLTDFIDPGPARTLADAPAMQAMPEALKAALGKGDHSQFVNEGEVRAMLEAGMEVFSHGCRHQGAFRSLRPLARMGEAHARWPAWGIYSDAGPDWPVFEDGSAYVYDGFWPRPGKAGRPRMVLRSPAERLDFCRRDFARSIERIRELNRLETQLFCWPWGHFCADAQAELERAGFAGAFTLERFVNARGTDPFRLSRIGVGRGKTGEWVRARLRMYGSAPAARVFFKFWRKRPEIRRVLYAADTHLVPGDGRQMLDNIRAMRDMGVDACALLDPASPLFRAVEESGAGVFPFSRFGDSAAAGAGLRKLVREEGVDVVHVFDGRAFRMGVLARLLGGRFRLVVNRDALSRSGGLFPLWTGAASGVICDWAGCAEALRRRGAPASRLSVVYDAYRGPDFGEPAPRRKRGTRLLYVGDGTGAKGFDVFLRAAARFCRAGDHRDVEFAAVGVREADMALFDHLLTPAVRERLRVVGEIPRHAVLEEMRASDVLVIPPRLADLPGSLLEGFSLGLPAVCTRVGGMTELVADGVNGLICESEDHDCLAAKMRQLVQDPAARFAMGRVGRAVVRTLLTPEVKAHALMRVYMGERLNAPLPVVELADSLPPLPGDPFGGCSHD
ncbi:glycosyltransferase [Pseudodesulfovibrio sp. F-1]|uniref:Glycosyltransferase n=1 Tax=Pseudodesulfovibrio alkaliphilus TaxID=2661613 RepID=A0A7K1KM35_9BACT|nr:glycosyltransferase [Pseudodesulfovibrio alkaliphilus]MUM77139.1 glycosyltransferase [Pseudodesulfovibrio alkaliphilus]